VTLRSALSLINNREDSFIARYGAQIEEHNKAILAQVEINNAQAVEHRQAIALQAEINNDQTLAIQTLKECCEKLQERLTTSEKDRDTTKKENDVLKAKLKSNEQQIEHLCKTLGVQKVTDIRPRRSADRASTVIKDLKSKDEKQDEKINTINQKVGKLGEKVDQKVDKLDEKFDPTLGAIEWVCCSPSSGCLLARNMLIYVI
jgi:chromosome segregation ATPase